MSQDKVIVKRLDVIIRLLLEQQVLEGKTKREDQLLLMDSIGLTSTEIGKIMNKEPKNISSHINLVKKRRAQKKK